MHVQLSPNRMSVPAPYAVHPGRRQPWEAVGIASVVLLLVALIASGGARVLLAPVALFGLVCFRIAAARGGWARRGLAWSPN